MTPTAPRRRAPAVVAALAAALCLLVATSCGVPLDDEPRAVTSATQPQETTPTTSDSPTAQEVSVYYLVGDSLEVTRFVLDYLALPALLSRAMETR